MEKYFLKNISTMNATPDEKMKLIKFQLSQAVSRHYTVFMQVNGFTNTFKKLIANVGKITKGIITVKELILIVAWAIYDLVVRGGMLSLSYPIDILVLFCGLVTLKVVDVNKGFANVVADMYKESMVEQDSNIALTNIEHLIIQLGYLFTKEQDKMLTPEIRAEEIIKELGILIPKLKPLN